MQFGFAGLFYFIVGGLIFRFLPPRKINHIYGWRTKFAMKNQDTWDESRRYGSKMFMIVGLCLAIIGGVLNALSINLGEAVDAVAIFGSIIIIIASGEIHLRKVFNQDGTRKISSN